MNPVCRNIQTDDLYLYQGGNNFKNIRTGAEGNIETDKAEKILKVNIEATTILNEYPIVQDMIRKLNLKMEKEPTCEKQAS